MKPTKLILSLAVCLLFAMTASAQTSIDKANAMYDKLSFNSVIPNYLLLAKNNKNPEAIIKLANCYRMINDMKNAEEWYKEAVKLNESEPNNKLYYAQALMANEQYNEAKFWLNDYLTSVPSDKRAKNLADACNNIKSFQNLNSSYEVFQLPYPINTSKSEMGPSIYKGDLIFSSDRDSLVVRNSHSWTGRNFYEIYNSSVRGDVEVAKYGKPSKIGSKNTLTRFHEGPVTFTKDGNTMIFTRNNFSKAEGVGKDNEGTVKLKLYQADLSSGKWSSSDGSAMSFNSDQYNVAHPALTGDGKTLYFSSDMPGGYGGMDIYVARKSGNGYSNPVNAGPAINTEGDEVFPFVDNNGTLYFASNGQPGMGGLDVFSADGEGSDWSAVTNLGNPINSSFDDFGFVSQDAGDGGYFVSNRAQRAVGDDDIYAFKRCVIKMNGIVVDKNTDEPIANAIVKLEEFGKGLGSVKSDASGKFSYNVGCDKEYKVCGNKDGYGDAVCKTIRSSANAKIPLFVKLPLEAKKLNNCTITGTVVDKKYGTPVAGAFIKFSSSNDLLTSLSDENGRFSVQGSPFNNYSINASKEGFFADIQNKQIGDCMSTNYSSTSEVRMQLTKIEVGAVVEIQNVYYDLNKYDIRYDAALELDKIVDLMRNNPSMSIELGSHTDCRATIAYNEKLSSNRARSAADYIVQHGIGRDRITSRGYGESILKNGCACEGKVKSPCSEAEHQNNRRTEIKVTGYNGGSLIGKDRQF